MSVMIVRAAALMAVLLLGGCVAGGNTHVDPRGRCQDSGPFGTETTPRALWYLFCIQSP